MQVKSFGFFEKFVAFSICRLLRSSRKACGEIMELPDVEQKVFENNDANINSIQMHRL